MYFCRFYTFRIFVFLYFYRGQVNQLYTNTNILPNTNMLTNANRLRTPDDRDAPPALTAAKTVTESASASSAPLKQRAPAWCRTRTCCRSRFIFIYNIWRRADCLRKCTKLKNSKIYKNTKVAKYESWNLYIIQYVCCNFEIFPQNFESIWTLLVFL